MADDHEALTIKRLVVGDVTVLHFVGRLDRASAAKAQEILTEAVNTGASLVLDLAGLALLSSIGLRLILKAMKQAQATRQPFVLAAPQDCVKEVLDAAELGKHCPIHPDRESAVEAVK